MVGARKSGAAGGGGRELSRSELAGWEGPLPRVILICGGDPVLAAEALEGLLSRSRGSGFEGFNEDRLHAAEVKLRDLASRLEELPLLAAERTIVVKGAEALLKHKAEDLARTWPPAVGSTVLVLVAADEDARPARKGAASWRDALPAHAVRVNVGTPTVEDALRWGRSACQESGAAVSDEAWRKAHRRARGDGARLRTEIEWQVLSALSGRPVATHAEALEATLEESAEAVRAALAQPGSDSVWTATEKFRTLGGSMDSRGAEWIRGLAQGLLRSDSASEVAVLRALSTLQLRWRRETGTARQVLERTGLELALVAARRGGRKTL